MTDFNTDTATVIIVHGYTESHDSNTVQAIRDAYLHASDLNVVVFNWWMLARGPHYDVAARNTMEAGRRLANFLDSLIRETQTTALRGLHIVGFSLGAQVAGIAASQLKTGLVPRITALDPAKPKFEIRTNDERLDAGDAEFVQVIHTASGFLSFLEPVGHADFYPNGGKAPQPPCSAEEALVCSHRMACTYFAESVYRPLAFPASLCDSWNNFKQGKCHGNIKVFMGAFAPTSARGKFYLKTNSEAPYGEGQGATAAEDISTPSPNCNSSYATDINSKNSLGSENAPRTTQYFSNGPTDPSIQVNNDTHVSKTERKAAATSPFLSIFILLIVLFVIFILVLSLNVVMVYCRWANVTKQKRSFNLASF
ncbi:phospholipase A1 1-like isoform X2 [Zootermopsis nevadensis]|uniref:Lipase member H n=2 Tax=Zootermopsis nevadensis TaxID=136037 RepID=A0A067QXJ2_ZOONE|nr:phospholipase A1 1-like isoform X2 [Zootermopsis nevadensis]XP_021928514.1 phospholipase A1 1-like isoform X2 [Zootermopsis nevadensis]KDR14939.1 Lipase member H [Zootermopsis nevadensis]